MAAWDVRISTMAKTTATTLTWALALGLAVCTGMLSAQQTPAPKAPAPNAPTPKTPAQSADNSPLKTQTQKFSYALGMNLGNTLHHQSVEVDPQALTQGLKDALSGGKTLLTEDEARSAIIKVQNELRAKQMAEQKAASAKNQQEGEAFLAANKTKPGVVTLQSGLQYKILKEGTGPKPSRTDKVTVNYRGTLIDGTEFDSSYKRGEPATFPVNGVIEGWTEALQLMPVGSKWQLFIPSILAYGERGSPPKIGPETTLIFEVELLSIEGKK
jgi:FKBP-type peptidyl-prolyl cis-trans isomerase FklB